MSLNSNHDGKWFPHTCKIVIKFPFFSISFPFLLFSLIFSLLLHHSFLWKFLHHSQSLCCYYNVFCCCCGGCFMSSLFCVVVMSHVVVPFFQFSIHVVVQRLCLRFWGCCYNVSHGCCGSHSSSLLCVVLLHCQ